MKIYLLGKGRGFIFFFFTMICLSLHAKPQQGQPNTALHQQTVTGTVSDTTGPIPGVTVQVKGTSLLTVSDAQGHFSITANTGDTLVFSSLGYVSKESTITVPDMGVIYLEEDTTTLAEVTINAGYYTVKRKEATGSIARVTAADIAQQPVSSPLAALQGRMTGVNITQSSGIPGSGFSIQVRGINSLRTDANDPLYIINGVPYPSQSQGTSAVNGAAFTGLSSPLATINPADIESIEVLKDADATAIYGSRGANGVVLITTKRGKSGKTAFDLQAYTSAGTITRKIDLLSASQYLAMRQQAFANDGIATYPSNAYDLNGTWDNTRATDWQKELIGGTAQINQAQLTASGGSDHTQFLIGGTIRRETTVYPGDASFSRAAVNTAINHQSTDGTFTMDFSAAYTRDKNTLPGVDLTRQAYTLAPVAPALYDAEGGLNWENGTFENPLAYLESEYENKTAALVSNLNITYRLPYGFKAKASLGYTTTSLSETRTLPAAMYNPYTNPSSAYSELLVNNADRQSWIVEPQLQWEKAWDAITLDALTGATFQGTGEQAQALDGFGFSSDQLIHSLAAASSVRVLNEKDNEYRYTAAFGRVNLGIKKRYFINLTGRRDASSRFGADNRFANFGAAGAGWIFSGEPWLAISPTVLSFGKLRASYGITGSDQIGDYQYLSTYEISPNLYNGVVGLVPSRLSNPNFGWENNRKLEAALELGFLKDRITLSLAAYRNRSSSQLVGMPLPGTTGFSSIQSNLDATVENSGLELELYARNIETENFRWTTTFNITSVKNKLRSFPGLETSTYANTYLLGHSLGVLKLYDYTGIDPQTGTYTFRDVNGDGQLTSADDRSVAFDNVPKYYGGLGNKLTYKKWSLDFLFQFVKQQALNPIASFPVTGLLSNQPSQAANAFPDPGASVQQYTSGANFGAFLAYYRYIYSDAMITDASYIRLKSLSLSYDITPQGGALSARVYLQGQNLLTFTNYKGADPENRSAMYLPPLRQLTLGVQLHF